MEGRLAATREAMQGIPKAHRSRVELSEFPLHPPPLPISIISLIPTK